MTLNEFQNLPDEEKISVVKTRLGQLVKENKKKTTFFQNEYCNFSWTSAANKMLELGYKLDQKTYELYRYVRDGEIIVNKQEIENLKKQAEKVAEYEMEIQELKRKNKELEEIGKKDVKREVSGQYDLMLVLERYDLENKENFSVNIPVEINNKWKTYATKSIYEKYAVLCGALINLIDNYNEDDYEVIEVLKTNDKYKTGKNTSFSMSIPKGIKEDWKEMCDNTKYFTNSQMVAYALEEYMKKYGDE